jgi:hypothetical protein
LNNSCVQDAIGKIKQQCSDFVMTRNIQCREMIEDVQRKLAAFLHQHKTWTWVEVERGSWLKITGAKLRRTKCTKS